MRIPEVVTSPGKLGFDPTRPMPATPRRWGVDERFEPDSTALRRRVEARLRIKLASRRHDASPPHSAPGDREG
jgi:hypothetical protein